MLPFEAILSQAAANRQIAARFRPAAESLLWPTNSPQRCLSLKCYGHPEKTAKNRNSSRRQ
jgi:hypothetical protein